MMGSKWKFVLVMSVCMLGLVARAETVVLPDADTLLSNDSDRGPGVNHGSASQLQIRWHSAPRVRITYVRYDISGISSGSYASAILKGTCKDSSHDGPLTANVWGLNDDVVAGGGIQGNDWDESTVNYSNAGGVDNDAALGTFAFENATFLGTMVIDGQDTQPLAFSSNTTDLPLQSFLGTDTDGLVTFMIIDSTQTGKEVYIDSKEGNTSDGHGPMTLNFEEPMVMPVYPEDGQPNVELNVTLTWQGLVDSENPDRLDPNVMAHHVYIDFDNTDTDPNLAYQGQVLVSNWSDPNASWGPLSLSLDDSVSWQIEEAIDTGSGTAGDPNNIFGPVWSFTAIKSVPVISQDQPADIRAFPSGPAVFSVDFTSISTPTVRWYHDDNTTVTEVTSGITTTNNGGGSYTTELDLGTSLDSTVEGQYYCTVQNSSGPTEYPSGTGNLVVKRQLAQYDFNGGLADSSSNGAPTGTALDSLGDPNTAKHVAGTVNYVTGADGTGSGALYLDSNEYINFGTDGYPKASAVTTNGFGGGMDEGTIVYWIKPNVDVFQVLLANFNAADSTGFLTALQEDQDFDVYIRDAESHAMANHPAGQPDRPEYDLTDGAWHMMAVCWNGANSSLYVDGQWVIDGTGAAPTSFAAWQYGVLLGAARSSSNRQFLTDPFAGGAVDNLRIYNYRLDDAGNDVFAQEFLDNTGIRPCTNMNFLDGMINTNFDNSGSSYCIVNLADFAVFAESWLANGLY